jgi:hypothetical protein
MALDKTDQAVITCTGATQSLASFLSENDYRHWIIHYLSGSSNIYFGYSDQTDADDHVFRIPPSTAPFMMEMSIVSLKPSQVWFKGTVGETFSIGVIAGRY